MRSRCVAKKTPRVRAYLPGIDGAWRDGNSKDVMHESPDARGPGSRRLHVLALQETRNRVDYVGIQEAAARPVHEWICNKLGVQDCDAIAVPRSECVEAETQRRQ